MNERFDGKIFVGNPNECWPWTSGKNWFGHGRFWNGKTNVQAHRIAWQIRYGPIPDGLCVLHRCDNPSCCNPSHLFLGTRIDNNKDRDRKLRYHTVLSEGIVRAVRSETGLSQRALDRKYGLTNGMAGKIIKRQVWAHVD